MNALSFGYVRAASFVGKLTWPLVLLPWALFWTLVPGTSDPDTVEAAYGTTLGVSILYGILVIAGSLAYTVHVGNYTVRIFPRQRGLSLFLIDAIINVLVAVLLAIEAALVTHVHFVHSQRITREDALASAAIIAVALLLAVNVSFFVTPATCTHPVVAETVPVSATDTDDLSTDTDSDTDMDELEPIE